MELNLIPTDSPTDSPIDSLTISPIYSPTIDDDIPEYNTDSLSVSPSSVPSMQTKNIISGATGTKDKAQFTTAKTAGVALFGVCVILIGIVIVLKRRKTNMGEKVLTHTALPHSDDHSNSLYQ